MNRFKSGLMLLALTSLLSSACQPSGAGRIYHNRMADPRPTVAVTCQDQTYGVSGTTAVPNSSLEVWLTGLRAGGFKAGIYHPRDIGGKKVADVTTDESGRFDLALEREAYQSDSGEPLTLVWLVYPPGDVVAPFAAELACPANTAEGS